MVGILGHRRPLVLQPPPNARAFHDLRFVIPDGAAEPARVSNRPTGRAARLDNNPLCPDRGRLASHWEAQQVGPSRRSYERSVIHANTADKHLHSSKETTLTETVELYVEHMYNWQAGRRKVQSTRRHIGRALCSVPGLAAKGGRGNGG